MVSYLNHQNDNNFKSIRLLKWGKRIKHIVWEKDKKQRLSGGNTR